jgi:hypothetical protein
MKKYYKIQCEWDMGFGSYSTVKKAEKAIEDQDWSEMARDDERKYSNKEIIEQLKEDGYLKIREVTVE